MYILKCFSIIYKIHTVIELLIALLCFHMLLYLTDRDTISFDK